MTTALTCPVCTTPSLQICYPTWFRFTEPFGPLDATTFVDVDAEAEADVYCTTCETLFTAEIFHAYGELQ